MNSAHSSVYFLGQSKKQRSEPLYQVLIRQFQKEGEFLSVDESSHWLACYDQDSQSVFRMPPLLVFKPHSLSVISDLVKACCQLQIPLTSRCGGTGLSGSAIASQGGLVVLTGHFRSILDYDSKKGTMLVEPGVTPRQINQLTKKDQWQLPLEMATQGVAGLAGCLSTAAKGYRQAFYNIAHSIPLATFIDGKGEKQQLSGAMLSGTEGMLGIMTQLALQLSLLPQKKLTLQLTSDWSVVVEKILQLKQITALSSATWQPDKDFHFILEGEEWRVKSSFVCLQRIFPTIEESFTTDRELPNHSVFRLSHAVPLTKMNSLLEFLSFLGEEFQIAYQTYINLLESSLHISFFSQEKPYTFFKKLEQFLVIWVEQLERHQAFLVSRHGVGPFLRHYLPPFYREEDLHFFKQLHLSFDPHQIFLQNHFFPSLGKSLEKR